jgi:nitroimidazol reductase NimA-like FMN-containing flavoprotein (pyridoxamine 5'-phosphate oxidase superfamily)
MSAPAFFQSDARRTEYAWSDWAAVASFMRDHAVCRIAVNDVTWPYVVAQTFRFVGDAFLLHFGRNGHLATALRRDPYCTIEIDEIVSLLMAPQAQNTSAEYRSVVARCTVRLTDVDDEIEAQQYDALDKYRPEADYLPIDRERGTRRISAVRAEIIELSAKKRILDEGGNPAGVAYVRYPFPPAATLSALPADAFAPRFSVRASRPTRGPEH